VGHAVAAPRRRLGVVVDNVAALGTRFVITKRRSVQLIVGGLLIIVGLIVVPYWFVTWLGPPVVGTQSQPIWASMFRNGKLVHRRNYMELDEIEKAAVANWLTSAAVFDGKWSTDLRNRHGGFQIHVGDQRFCFSATEMTVSTPWWQFVRPLTQADQEIRNYLVGRLLVSE
jgi:hypothetical protein